ncbi:hypothetical protein ACLB2K_047632 [Fragaria x ananassa]
MSHSLSPRPASHRFHLPRMILPYSYHSAASSPRLAMSHSLQPRSRPSVQADSLARRVTPLFCASGLLVPPDYSGLAFLFSLHLINSY